MKTLKNTVETDKIGVFQKWSPQKGGRLVRRKIFFFGRTPKYSLESLLSMNFQLLEPIELWCTKVVRYVGGGALGEHHVSNCSSPFIFTSMLKILISKSLISCLVTEYTIKRKYSESALTGCVFIYY